MDNLHSRIEDLCRRKSIKIAQLCRDIEIRSGLLSDLKMGRSKSLSTETITKIANYFDVSVDYLLTGNEKTPGNAEGVREDDIKVALFGGAGEVTDEMWDEVKDFVEYVKMREAKKRAEDTDK